MKSQHWHYSSSLTFVTAPFIVINIRQEGTLHSDEWSTLFHIMKLKELELLYVNVSDYTHCWGSPSQQQITDSTWGLMRVSDPPCSSRKQFNCSLLELITQNWFQSGDGRRRRLLWCQSSEMENLSTLFLNENTLSLFALDQMNNYKEIKTTS